MKKKTVANKERNKLLAKRGIPLVLTLAVLILLVNVITASYSWFSPTSLSGAGMKFQQSDFIRSENCSLKLFQGTKVNGVITYSEVSTNTSVDSTPSTDPTVGLNYFRVVVKNDDTVNASNVSILFNCTINADTTIGIMTPSNAVHTYTSDMAEKTVFLVRNAYVKKLVSTEVNPGELYVDFFIRYTGSDSFTLSPSDLIILYN